MLKFGDGVIIRDGSLLDGQNGIVYSVEGNRVAVLVDREVFWPVASECRESPATG